MNNTFRQVDHLKYPGQLHSLNGILNAVLKHREEVQLGNVLNEINCHLTFLQYPSDRSTSIFIVCLR